MGTIPSSEEHGIQPGNRKVIDKYLIVRKGIGYDTSSDQLIRYACFPYLRNFKVGLTKADLMRGDMWNTFKTTMMDVLGWTPEVFPFFNPDIDLQNKDEDEDLTLQWFALLHMSILMKGIDVNGRTNLGFVMGWKLPRDYIIPAPYTVKLDVLSDLGVLDVKKTLGIAENSDGQKVYLIFPTKQDSSYKSFSSTSSITKRSGSIYIMEKSKDWSPSNDDRRYIGPFPDSKTAEVYAKLSVLLPGGNTFTGVSTAWFPQSDVYNDNNLPIENANYGNFQVTVGFGIQGGSLLPITAIQPLGSKPYVNIENQPTLIDTSKLDALYSSPVYKEDPVPVDQITLRRLPSGKYYIPNSQHFLGRQEVEFSENGSVVDASSGRMIIDATQVRTEMLTQPNGDLIINSYPHN